MIAGSEEGRLVVATVQRLARLALTRLDAPCSVTWDELQRSSGVC